MTRTVSRALLASFALASSLVLSPARADVTKDQCVEANASAQRLRLAGKLGAARRELLTCGDHTCPGIVRDDCARRLDELDRAQPSIIFDVKGEGGEDLPLASVTVDGASLTARLDGSAQPVDPGVHDFRFEAPGHAPVTRTLVVKEGEQSRRERVVIPAIAIAASTGSPDGSSDAARGGLGARRWLGIGLAGAGVASVVAGSVLGALAASALSDQQQECGSPTACPAAGHAKALADHDTVNTDGAASTATFIAGGALIAAGAVVFFTARKGKAPRVILAPSVGARAASLGLEATF